MVPAHTGISGLDDPCLLEIATVAVGLPARAVGELVFTRVEHEIGTPMTHSLWHVTATATTDDGLVPWTAFVKVLQSPWAWPGIDEVPELFRASFADGIPWQLEVQAMSGRLPEAMPPGLRMPRLFGVVETDEHHTALWTEWVEADRRRWDAADYRRAAYLLGRLAGRRPEGSGLSIRPEDAEAPPGAALRYFAFGRVQSGAVPALLDPGVWAHPAVVAAVEAEGEDAADLRAEIAAAAEQVPWWLDVLDGLPQAFQHGDASPENLLLTADEPDTIVVIDWGFSTLQAVGFDLGQLLVGQVHTGAESIVGMVAVLGDLVAAYQDGVAAESNVPTARVRLGCVASLVVRSLFTAIPLEHLGRPDDEPLRTLVRHRLEMTRGLLDLAHDELPWHEDPRSVVLSPPPLV